LHFEKAFYNRNSGIGGIIFPTEHYLIYVAKGCLSGRLEAKRFAGNFTSKTSERRSRKKVQTWGEIHWKFIAFFPLSLTAIKMIGLSFHLASGWAS
jgi:hypothetical protein